MDVEEDESFTNHTFPFFQTSDPALQNAYSYGDPHGGSYPDPPSPYRQESDLGSEPVEEEVEVEVRSLRSKPRSQNKSRLAEVNSDFSISGDDDDNDEDIQEASSGFESDLSNFSNDRRQRNNRGRGTGRDRARGRGIGRGGGRASSRGRTQPRIRSDITDVEPRRRRNKKKKQEQEKLDPEFQRLNGLVTRAWIDENYDEALNYALQAVKINPEVFPLHGTIAEILVKKGRFDDAIGALFAGVHSTNEPENWWYVVDRLIQIGQNSEGARSKLGYCYTVLISHNTKDYMARLGRLKVYKENGQLRRARNECQALLKLDPTDTDVLAQLAESCCSLDEPEVAMDYFEPFIDRCFEEEEEEPHDTLLSWSVLSVYLDLLIQVQKYDKAIDRLRSISRWLLGRGSESFWDDEDDDREWDIEDEPRRTEVESYIPGRYPLDTYGAGLPIELRIRLGSLRLLLGEAHFNEALSHFSFLNISDENDVSDIYENADLLREVGDVLRETGLHEEALQFYIPLKKIADTLESRLFLDMALCYQALGQNEGVRESIRMIKHGTRDPSFQIGLAKLYQSQGKDELMWRLIQDLRRMGMVEEVRRAGLPTIKPDSLMTRDEQSEPATAASKQLGPPRVPRRPRAKQSRGKPRTAAQRLEEENLQDAVVKALYEDILSMHHKLDNGDAETLHEWLSLVHELWDEFKSQREFFPRDKFTKFTGFRWGRFVRLPEGEEILHTDNIEFDLPVEFRKIHFDDWVDLLMEYCLKLAQIGDSESCWEVIQVAGVANVIYAEKPRYQVVRTTGLACAIILGDEKHVCEEVRWFCRNFPYSADSYRLFSMANRVCRGPVHYYNMGPEQKYFMRQVKAMDFALLDPANRSSFLFTDGNRVRWTEGGRTDGNPHGLTRHSITLISLYGHLMYCSGSHSTALNYYFRAYVLDPEDPVLNLCIALSFINMAFKRQSDNRQYDLQQGLTFLERYRELRAKDGLAIHLQEVEFNVGMVWHSLGLMHLALPAYERCMQLSKAVRNEQQSSSTPSRFVEDFATEAAFAAQQILALNGDAEGARNISRNWLVM